MTTAVVKPAKIKEYVGVIKGTFLDGGVGVGVGVSGDDHGGHDGTTVTTVVVVVKELYHALLRMECLLRGVLVPLDTDEDKLWTTIQNCIGKRLLNVDDDDGHSTIPKPLLAGMNVVAGRLAERCCLELKSSTPNSTGNNSTGNSTSAAITMSDVLPPTAIQGSIQRLQDIDDDRFAVLLRPTLLQQTSATVGTTTTASSSAPSAPVPKPPFLSEEVEAVASTLLQVALGYFTAAATIQKDTPPMWKKVWDTWTALSVVTVIPKTTTTTSSSSKTKSSFLDNNKDDERRRDANEDQQYDKQNNDAPPPPTSPPFEAQVAIENLSRIATSKGNTNRAAQLQLKLVQSYLNPNRLHLTPLPTNPTMNTKKKNEKKKPTAGGREYAATTSSILECFGDDITTSLLSKMDPILCTEKATEALDSCRTDFENDIDDENEQSSNKDGNVNENEISSNTFLFRVLHLQVVLTSFEANVVHQADEMYRMNQNRSVKTISYDDCLKKCRKKTFKEEDTYTSSSPSFETVRHAAETLRDTMISTGWPNDATQIVFVDESSSQTNNISTTTEIIISSLCRAAQRWLERSISYFVLWAAERNINRNNNNDNNDDDKNWIVLLKFIQPLLTVYGQRGNANVHGDDSDDNNVLIRYGGVNVDESIFLLSNVLTTFPRVCWMALDSFVHLIGDEMATAYRTLSRLIEWKEKIISLEKHERERNGSEEAVGSTDHNQSDKTMLEQWNLGKIATECFLCQCDAHAIQEVTRDALSTFVKRTDTISPGYVAYLTLLVAWSGMLQHPFTFCVNRIEVNQFLDCAKDSERPTTELESILVLLARADALNDESIYLSVIEKVKQSSSLLAPIKILIECHCANGLACVNDLYPSADIEALQSLHVDTVPQIAIWCTPSCFENIKLHLISVSRQLSADRILSTHPSKAASILAEAVMDSPTDPDAGLAYGSCLLRLAIEKSDNSQQAKNQLIKTAKLMDGVPSRRQADVFALLGIWFEHNHDDPRAVGCFKKSLMNDASNPIAGRGIIRAQQLIAGDALDGILDAAISQNSLVNGWAWCFIGHQEAEGGHDDRAAMALLKALRCKDIARPDRNTSLFYRSPQAEPSVSEKSSILAEVGECYWHLGRFTASIRAFHASIAAAGVMAPSTTLLSCAQIELELGLVDEAAERFAVVLERGEPSILPVASYWYSVTLFHIAKRDMEEGKATSALQKIKLAIASCERSNITYSCTFKLMGDIYSFGATVPPPIFHAENNWEERKDMDTKCLVDQLEFVKKGEHAFQSCLDSLDDSPVGLEQDSVALKSAILCDLACNILHQAEISSLLKRETAELFDDAAEFYREAIQLNPFDAYAWCGFGCAVANKDKLLAQHAFCQSSFLDKTYPDSYSNLGFLYTSKGSFNASKKTMDVLTEIADSPMMWINRAFLLEEEAYQDLLADNDVVERTKIEQRLSEAADAYRASLQVMNHPEAVMGLALTGRIPHSSQKPSLRDMSSRRKESLSLAKQYKDAVFGLKRDAMTLEGVGMMEKAFAVQDMGLDWSKQALKFGEKLLGTSSTEGRDSYLNNSALAQILELGDGEGTETKRVGESVKNEHSIQQQILIDPLRADLWISLTKGLMAQKKIASATDAARRAAFIVNEQVVSLRNNAEREHQVDCFLSSEAISLESWLLSISRGEDKKEIKSNAESAVTETKPTFNETDASYAFQRALMMNPTNIVARKGLENLV